MADLATVTDLESAWRPLTDQQTVNAQYLLTRASALVRSRVPGLDDRIAADPNVQVTASGVVVDMVLRVLKNPDGKSEESIDDYRYRRDASVATGSLYLADAELALLLPAPAAPLGSAFVVGLGG